MASGQRGARSPRHQVGSWYPVLPVKVVPRASVATDLLVARLLVVELKAVKTVEDVHFALVRAYLRATGRKHGLTLSFAKPTLSVKRTGY
jgi:GxxExxY protein